MTLFKPQLFEQYLDVLPILNRLLPKIAEEIQQQLSQAGIRLHSFGQRTKDPDSVRQKIARPDRTYETIWNITDLIGFRLVTAFEDSIDEIAQVLEKHFTIDLSHSTNRLQYEDHERFGYRSLHYICRFPDFIQTQAQLPENARFEIQVRTALQDVWAEIEHDLGYKASDIAPSKLRRRFSRVSSLLEIADEELVAVKSELKRYIETKKDHQRLDHITLKELARHPMIEKLDREIAQQLNLERSENIFFPAYLLRALKIADITSCQAALTALEKYSSKILEFVPHYFAFAHAAWGLDRKSLASVPRAYCLLFLAHVCLLQSEPLAVNRVKRLTNFYAKLDYPNEEEKAHEVASKLVSKMEHLL